MTFNLAPDYNWMDLSAQNSYSTSKQLCTIVITVWWSTIWLIWLCVTDRHAMVLRSCQFSIRVFCASQVTIFCSRVNPVGTHVCDALFLFWKRYLRMVPWCFFFVRWNRCKVKIQSSATDVYRFNPACSCYLPDLFGYIWRSKVYQARTEAMCTHGAGPVHHCVGDRA